MSFHSGQAPSVSEIALNWLNRRPALSPDACRNLATLAPALLRRLPRGAVTTLVISGPPGSGKSTLAGMLQQVLCASDRPALTLSLDDYYCSKQERESLSATRHPLFSRRGVPGTHLWAHLLRDIDQIIAGDIATLRLRRFDKSTDDVAPPEQWRSVETKPNYLIVEGWCLGAPPQAAFQLETPVNELERRADPDGAWRGQVNKQLGEYYTDLRRRSDQVWYVSTPGWQQVIDWRWLQEKQLAQRHLHSRDEVVSFLATFERIVMHMQNTCSSWADTHLQADPNHMIGIK